MHLLVVISSHGFGHTAQVAPVVNALRSRIPDLRLTLLTAAPRYILESRFDGPFEHIPEADDIGMIMSSAVDILAEESACEYERFHRDWDRAVDRVAGRLCSLAPDLVLSNVSYRVLAAAARSGIPAVALCSLNWADIYGHYCGDRPEAKVILRQMLEAYNAADWFLQTEPSMPMATLHNRRPIGPIARLGRNRRAEIDAALGLGERDRLVLVALGGIPMRLPMEAWPRLPDVRWVVQADWDVRRPDVVSLEALDMHFTDVLRSCDALITKPGYGSFAEAACNGTRVLYVKRHDWPEEPFLVDWLHRHGRCLEVARDRLTRGRFDEELELLLDTPPAPRVEPRGIDEAADLLAARYAGVNGLHSGDAAAQSVR